MLPRRFYSFHHLHFVTSSTYRPTRIFDSLRFREEFVVVLAALPVELGFHLIGYVLMPEHFHLLM
ncbi:MAG: hypothetical protein KGM47_11370 [Acidobacteriota bacterium]|nr:hypothetical protein [Acidobacteriota bacterium]